MERCFVIQPFDKDKFDKRFDDIFKPAINNAELEAYRIDKDPSVRIPIEDIEKGISESRICFADITLDNPNVWYELGFAFACGKDVILVCSEEITDKFPFDIQHRHIIKYKTGSISDFKSLSDSITKKLTAFLTKTKTVEQLNSTAMIETEGLKANEIALLVLVMENQITDEDSYSIWNLNTEMSKSGYNQLATSIGIKTLKRKGMIETFIEYDQWNQEQGYTACRLTESGVNWILSNQDQFQFRTNINKTVIESDDNLPF